MSDQRRRVPWAELAALPSRAELEKEARALVESSFPRTAPRRAWLHWGALAGSLALLWVTWFGVGGNLALGKPVTMSSTCKERPEHSWLPVKPERLVDGKKWRPFDACTEPSKNPWVQVDLEEHARIDRVVVTGRRNCCWAYQDLPIVLELSNDGHSFSEVARRELPFSDREPWRVSLAGAEGRYLRLRSVSTEPSELVLTEIEVFGSAVR